MLRQILNTFAPRREVVFGDPIPELDYRNLFESMEEGFASCQMIYDKAGKAVDFRYLYVNPAFAKQTGLSVEQVLGRTVKEVIPKIESFWIEAYGRVVSSGKSEHFENKLVSLGKQYEIKVWKSREGCFSVVFEDITDRKKEEAVINSKTKELEQLSKSQEDTKKAMLNIMEDLEDTKVVIEIEKVRDEAILASIGDGMIATDQNAKVIIMNEEIEKLIGWKRDEVIGKLWFEIVPMEDEKGNAVPNEERPIQQAISQKKTTTTTTTTTTTFYFIRKDKTKFPVAVTATPIILNGEVIGAVGIYRDITHETEVDKAKSEFVSLASHQLRTPLGIIKWYLESLQNDNYFKNAPSDTRKYFDEIYSSNERVLSLVRDLLSVSRIDQGKVKNVPKPISLTQTIEEIIDQMQIVARNKKVTLRLTIEDSGIPPITIDILRFHEAIENLITNALEYSLPESLVEVTLTKNDDTLLISVKDTGLGISKADLKLLFTKFFRSDEAVKHNPEGSGLGLYVVKSYVEGWGGKLTVQSEPGKGSTFTISLPIAQ